MMRSAVDLRPGLLVRHQGRIHTVSRWNILRNDRRQFVQLRLRDLETGRMQELKELSDSRFEVLDSSQIELSHSYRDGNEEVFYTADGIEYRLPASAAEEALLWPCESYKGHLVDEKLLSIDLPATVVLTVAETAPPLGGGATLMKEARLENGVEIKVSAIVASGDRVRVDPHTREFKERV